MSEAPPPAVVTYFEPRPAAGEVPARLASPFDPSPPHPLARRAAEELQARLRRGDVAAGFDPGVLDVPGGGKMFGVLVVAAEDGRIGYLQGFSGMLGGRWHVEGFAPPLFDPVARDTFWPGGQAELRTLALRHADTRESDAGRAEVEHLRAERSRQLWRQLTDSYVLPNARGERQSLTALFPSEAPPGGAGDCAAPKLLAWAYAHRLRPLAFAEFWWGASPVNGERHAGEYYPACQGKCGRVLPYMLEGLDVEPAPPGTGASSPGALRRVYEDAWLLVVDKPPGLPCAPGRHARRRDSVLVRLQRRDAGAATHLGVPAPDAESSRHSLQRGDADAATRLVAPAPEIEDTGHSHQQWEADATSRLGVPAPDAEDTGHSLQRDDADAAKLLVVHALDTEASGLLLLAKDAGTQAALRRQLARREADLRHVAWLEGCVTGDHGVIELPLRTDGAEGLRQQVDPAHGRHALTDWHVTQRTGTRTRVALLPRTRHAHQLRVHAAHPRGLGAAIVGDAVYGHEAPLLRLHAESLTFTHPRTGERLHFESPSPF